MLQGIPERLQPQARLHREDGYPDFAPRSPPRQAAEGVSPDAVFGPPHAKLHPRLLAQRQPQHVIQGRGCRRQGPRHERLQAQTDPGGALQGVRNVYRIEKERGMGLNLGNKLVQQALSGSLKHKLGWFYHLCSGKSANWDSKRAPPSDSLETLPSQLSSAQSFMLNHLCKHINSDVIASLCNLYNKSLIGGLSQDFFFPGIYGYLVKIPLQVPFDCYYHFLIRGVSRSMQYFVSSSV